MKQKPIYVPFLFSRVRLKLIVDILEIHFKHEALWFLSFHDLILGTIPQFSNRIGNFYNSQQSNCEVCYKHLVNREWIIYWINRKILIHFKNNVRTTNW